MLQSSSSTGVKSPRLFSLPEAKNETFFKDQILQGNTMSHVKVTERRFLLQFCPAGLELILCKQNMCQKN